LANLHLGKFVACFVLGVVLKLGVLSVQILCADALMPRAKMYFLRRSIFLDVIGVLFALRRITTFVRVLLAMLSLLVVILLGLGLDVD